MIKYNKPIESHIQADKVDVIRHGRNETRKVEIFKKESNPHTLGYLYDIEWNQSIRYVIKVTRTIITKTYVKVGNKGSVARKLTHKKSNQISYFISTTGILKARYVNQIIRNHWSIETHHYLRDIVLKEDESRIRKSPGVIARIRTIALNILNSKDVKTYSREIYSNSLMTTRLFVKKYRDV